MKFGTALNEMNLLRRVGREGSLQYAVYKLISSSWAAGTIIATIAAATIITSTAIISSATATVVTATRAAVPAAFVLFVGFFHRHFLASDRCVIQCLNCLACLCIVRHIHESEALALSGFPIHYYLSGVDSAI